MTRFDDDEQRARALWRRYRRSRDAAPETAAPDANLVAAWLEGRAAAHEAARVEAWFADAPGGAEELAALRELVAAPPLAPEAGVAVSPAGRPPMRSAAAWLRALVPAGSWPQAAATAAALVLACWLGFGLGEATYQGGARVSAAVAAELDFDPEDLAEDPFAVVEEYT